MMLASARRHRLPSSSEDTVPAVNTSRSKKRVRVTGADVVPGKKPRKYGPGRPFVKGQVIDPGMSKSARLDLETQNALSAFKKRKPTGTRDDLKAMLPGALLRLEAITLNDFHPRQEQAIEYLVDQALGSARQTVETINPKEQGGKIEVEYVKTPSLSKVQVTFVGPDGKAIVPPDEE